MSRNESLLNPPYVQARHKVSAATTVAGAVALAMLAPDAYSQSALLDPERVAEYTQIELAVATAVSDLYDFLQTDGGELCPQQNCPAIDELRFNLGILVDGGEDGFGYNLESPEALNNALRWLAPEELFALAPISTGFVNGQLGTLSNRISNTRSLSRARLFANNVVSDALKYGYASSAGAGASAQASQLNLFFDVSAGFGKRADTTDTGSENAFDFDGYELSLGLDWRFSDNLVSGALLGYTNRQAKFDPDKSAASGRIDSTGGSLLAFVQWDDFRWYGSAVVGYQRLSYDMYRRIDVQSEAPDFGGIASPDSAAEGSPKGSGIVASLNAGLPFNWGAWGTDFYLNAAWQRQTVNGFSEELVDISPDENYSGFAYDVGKQRIKSLDTSVGFKLQYVATPSFGVLIPFVRTEFHQELEDSPRTLSLKFQDPVDPDTLSEAQEDALEDALSFTVRSDRPDKSWFSVAAGVSAVLRGSSRVSDSGRAGGGLQAYLQYSTAFGLAHYDSGAIAAGLRYEF